MAMPIDLVLVRHGESEANVVQRAEKLGLDHFIPEDFYDRPDWQHRLSIDGREQAKAAGQWILKNMGDPSERFDIHYFSPFLRTRETADIIGGAACKWFQQDRLRERSWGTYGAVPMKERLELFKHTERMKAINPLYAVLDGGESIAGNVYMQARDLFDTFHREASGKSVLGVTHGEFMWTMRFLMEKLLPEEWQAMDADKSLRIGNCCILWYSRVNPDDPEDIQDKVSWRRMIDPVHEEKSPYGGEWHRLQGKRHFSGADLHKSLEMAPPLLSPKLQAEVALLIEAAGK